MTEQAPDRETRCWNGLGCTVISVLVLNAALNFAFFGMLSVLFLDVAVDATLALGLWMGTAVVSMAIALNQLCSVIGGMLLGRANSGFRMVLATVWIVLSGYGVACALLHNGAIQPH